MAEAQYKVGHMRFPDTGELHSAIYKLNGKGDWDYYFLVDDRKTGERLLKDPERIERLYRKDRLLIAIFTIGPIIGLGVAFLYSYFG